MPALTIVLAVLSIAFAVALFFAPASYLTLGLAWCVTGLLVAMSFGGIVKAGSRGRHERY